MQGGSDAAASFTPSPVRLAATQAVVVVQAARVRAWPSMLFDAQRRTQLQGGQHTVCRAAILTHVMCKCMGCAVESQYPKWHAEWPTRCTRPLHAGPGFNLADPAGTVVYGGRLPSGRRMLLGGLGALGVGAYCQAGVGAEVCCGWWLQLLCAAHISRSCWTG